MKSAINVFDPNVLNRAKKQSSDEIRSHERCCCWCYAVVTSASRVPVLQLTGVATVSRRTGNVMATRAASDRVFLSCLIPLAIATFLSGPLAVLHHGGHLDYAVQRFLNLTLWNHDRDLEEVPLLFHADAYPIDGKKTITLQDQRLHSLLTAFNASQSSIALSMSSPSRGRLIIGYVPVNETLKLQSRDPFALLEGSLLRVSRVTTCEPSSSSSSIVPCQPVVYTELEQPFRVRKVRRDQVSGVLYAQIERIRRGS